MSIYSDGVTVYRLNPADVENFLTAKYGRKITAVNQARMAKQNQRIANFNARFKKPDV